MQKTIQSLAVLLVIALNAGCMFTINGNPDVSLVSVRVSPIAMTLPLLDSGDNAAPLTLLAVVTGAGANTNVSWVSTGVGNDSILGNGLSATYYLSHLSNFASIFDTVRATSTTDFTRVGKLNITYAFPGDVPFIAVPMDVTLLENSSIQFEIDTIHGHTVNNVTWSVIGGLGTITTSGLYIAPSNAGQDTYATILAKSGTDTSTATVHILRATDSLKCFSRDIKPIIGESSGCAGSGCHGGGGNRQAFDYSETLHNVKPGDARGSRLYQIITELNANDRMPPPPAPSLTPQQIQTIGQWIDQGALECQ
jgi:hypothetical protein